LIFRKKLIIKNAPRVLQLLDSDWGKQPKTLPELGGALKANAVHYPYTTISGVLA
jgi:hypothetical protein